MRRWWSAFAVVVALGNLGAASPVPLSAEFLDLPEKELEPLGVSGSTSSQVEVGDSYRLKVTGLEGDIKSAAPPEGASSLNELGWEVEVKRAESGGTEPKGAQPHWEIAATPLKSGRLTLPVLEIKDAGDKSVARTRPFTLDVVSAIEAGDPQPQSPIEVRPPVPIAFPWWFVVLLGILVIAAVVGAVWAWRKWGRGRGERTPAVVEPPRPEDILAMEALAGVEQAGWVKAGQFKKHYFRVSEILKRYLGLRFEFEAAESTTHELIRALDERKLCDAATLDRIESLFTRMDRVKFTDEVPEVAQGLRILEEARAIVQATKRLPIVTAPPPQTEVPRAVR